MRDRGYGRIVFTSSASGIYGNFGQANYGAAKAAMIGLMNVLHLEGAKNDIRVNVLAPTAATGMTEGLLPPVAAAADAGIGDARRAVPGRRDAPSRIIMGAGARRLRRHPYRGNARRLSRGEPADAGKDRRALRRNLRSESAVPLKDAFGQTMKFIAAAARAKGVTVG